MSCELSTENIKTCCGALLIYRFHTDMYCTEEDTKEEKLFVKRTIATYPRKAFFVAYVTERQKKAKKMLEEVGFTCVDEDVGQESKVIYMMKLSKTEANKLYAKERDYYIRTGSTPPSLLPPTPVYPPGSDEAEDERNRRIFMDRGWQAVAPHDELCIQCGYTIGNHSGIDCTRNTRGRTTFRRTNRV